MFTNLPSVVYMLFSFFRYLVRFCMLDILFTLSVFVWVLVIFILTFFVCLLNIFIILCTYGMSVIHFHYFAFFFLVRVLYTFHNLHVYWKFFSTFSVVQCCIHFYALLYSIFLLLHHQGKRSLSLDVWSIRRKLMCIGTEQYRMKVGLFKHYLKNRHVLTYKDFFCISLPHYFCSK